METPAQRCAKAGLERYMASADPDLERKAAAVIGL